jgi:hypothetical protein
MFRDAHLQSRFEREGYVELDLLTNDEVEHLIHLHDLHSAELDATPVAFTAMHPVSDSRRVLSEGIRNTLSQPLDAVLKDCRTVLGNFFCKQPSTDSSAIHIHQDWSFVDENEHDSLSVWCPLENISHESGTLSVVPGSHRLPSGPRGFETHFPFGEVEGALLSRYSIETRIHPGQVLLFHQRLFHWSPPNRSSERRVAANCFVAPREATVFYPHPDPVKHPDSIELFVANDGLLTSFVIGKRPDAESAGFVEKNVPTLSEADLEQMLGPLWVSPS